MKTIERKKYLDKLQKVNGTPDIKVITGVRRSGKSKLMDSYIDWLEENEKNLNIIYIDFTNLKYEELKEYHQGSILLPQLKLRQSAYTKG